MGRGASITVGKFLCHLEGHPGLKAFMRIYHQIPIAGTEYADPDILAQRAVLPEVYGELESLMLLKGCPAVPQFLGHAKKKHKESTDSLLVATHIFRVEKSPRGTSDEGILLELESLRARGATL
ncbi:hypothetical protein EN45_102270 [Penicillium chrysogenum]|jgi:hypothetical protein|uniref:Uncharacterized protein n=2 Tax=Penicillium chrysogenum species complex TaxID=254878 RepID=B6HPM4_PENRW|nr:uncharacterized protein N7525_005937 [Penicillium rubens]KAJ5840749.1 hypothetical protein N7525_005937 [Penicillium rubens]KZN86031.1 hypothetical protein EN45_102270 [Penicillium chrysogenum]CAP97553.1 hypothetical protein PCH_Pc22g02650 [Penicillium rubens Wisconsin 54-1255]